MATVNARAEEYKESEAFGDTPMDVLRAHAYLDLINGMPAAERIALAEQQDDDGRTGTGRARRRERGTKPGPPTTMPVRARTLEPTRTTARAPNATAAA